MKEVIEKLMTKASEAGDACQALQFSQAALNVSNANRVRADMPGTAISEDQIKHMVTRFLGWRLPENFKPDDGISFDPIMNRGNEFESRRTPSGTNLFDGTQADAMVRYMIEGL